MCPGANPASSDAIGVPCNERGDGEQQVRHNPPHLERCGESASGPVRIGIGGVGQGEDERAYDHDPPRPPEPPGTELPDDQ